MKETLQKIDNSSGSERLALFLRKNFPQMIKSGTTATQKQDDSEHLNSHGVFDSYVPGILTYPRRIIFVGPKRELIREVRQFCLDKPVSDSIIVEDRAYVEYLDSTDLHLQDAIPLKNWQIAAYRNKHSV